MYDLSIVITGFSQAIGVNYADLSPYYPGLFSIGNTIANVAGMLAPIVVGHILVSGQSHHRRSRVAKVFYISTAVLVALWPGGALPGKPQVLN